MLDILRKEPGGGVQEFVAGALYPVEVNRSRWLALKFVSQPQDVIIHGACAGIVLVLSLRKFRVARWWFSVRTVTRRAARFGDRTSRIPLRLNYCRAAIGCAGLFPLRV